MYPPQKWITLSAVAVCVALVAPVIEPIPAFSLAAQSQADSTQKAAGDRHLQQGAQHFKTANYRAAEASFQQAVVLYRQGNDRLGEAQALTQLSEVYYWMGRYSAGLEMAQAALTHWQALKNRKGEGEALDRLAEAQSELAGYAKALETLQQALAIRREVADALGEAKTLVRIGAISYKKGDLAKALEALQQGQQILQTPAVCQVDVQVCQMELALTLGWIGWLQFNQRNQEQGLATLQSALQQSREIQYGAGEFNALYFIAEAYFQQKEYAKALVVCQQSLPIAQTSGNRYSTLYIFKAIANMHRQLQQPDQALKTYQQALAFYQSSQIGERDSADWAILGDLHNLIGVAHYRSQQYPPAISAFQQALTHYQKAGDRLDDLALVWTNLGNSYRDTQQFTQAATAYHSAIAVYQSALVEAQKLDDRSKAVELWKSIASLYRQRKQPIDAIKTYQQALDFLQKKQSNPPIVDDSRLTAEIYNLIGVTHYNSGQYAPAIAAFRQSLTHYETVSDRVADVALVGANLGDAYRDTQQFSQALESYQTALAGYQKLDDRAQAIGVLKKIATTYRQNKQPEKAIQTYQNALALYQKSELSQADFAEMGSLHNRIGIIYLDDLEKYPEAIASLQQSLTFYEKTNQQFANRAQVWLNLGLLHYKLQQYSQAIAPYEQALSLYRQVADEVNQAEVLSKLSAVYRQLGQTDKALETHQQARKLNQSGIELPTDPSISATPNLAIEGVWQIDTASNGLAQSYTGTVTISRIEQRYGLLWETSTGPRLGIALVENGQLFVSWREGTGNLFGLAFYRIEQDGSLAGKWMEGSRSTGTEQAMGGTPGQLAGNYQIKGTNYNGSEYSGKLRIEQTGETYQLFWDAGTEYRGVGIRVGDYLVSGWGSDGVPGVAVYTVKGDRLEGQLASLNQPKLGAETLSLNPIASQQNQQKIAVIRLQTEANNLWAEGKGDAAIAKLQQGLTIAKTLPDRTLEATLLKAIGVGYANQEQYLKTLEYYKSALKIYQALDDRREIAKTLNQMGVVYSRQGQFLKSRELFQQALTHYRALGDRPEEGTVLSNLGNSYTYLGDYAQALELLQQALKIHQAVGARSSEGIVLNDIGATYAYAGAYPKALEFYEQALIVHYKAGHSTELGKTQMNMGNVYADQGAYPKALATYEQALQTIRTTLVKNRAAEAAVFHSLGRLNGDLGLPEKALEFYQQVLSTYQALGYRASEGKALITIGRAYLDLKQFAKADEFYQKGLAIARSVGDLSGESDALYGLGRLHTQQARPQAALEVLQQALNLDRTMGARAKEAQTLSRLGQVQMQLGQRSQAQLSLQRSLTLAQDIGDRPTEAIALASLGELYAQQNQTQVAITFYKQSVNITETIRDNIRSLSSEQQRSYTATVANTYRQLADLLIAQGRIAEGQQVLELLKIQELNDFTRGTRSAAQLTDVPLNETEQKIRDQYGTLIAFGKQLNDCNQTCANYQKLLAQYDALNLAFVEQVTSIEQAVRDRRQEQVGKGTQEFIAGADKIVSAQPGTVLIYPLVLPDKVRILWAANGTVLSGAAVCPLGETQLWQTITEFRQLLSTPNSRLEQVQTTGKQLYDCLIKPIEKELRANQIRHLVFVPDRATNYIPMGALFDGKQFLINTYTISSILSVKGTDMSARLPRRSQDVSALALGLSKAVGGFNALPNVPAELDAIVKPDSASSQGIYLGTKRLNQDFTEETLRTELKGRSILHIATHAAFKPENPRQSYLLLGTGTEYPIQKIQFLQNLRDVHLVVLSACETALGGTDPKNGIEVMGISSYFLEDKAKAVVASLWLVNDASTRLLMQQFYQNLAKGTLTKAQALQQAQQGLLAGNVSAAIAPPRSDIEVAIQSGVAGAPRVSADFSHPYYWAPFILIGNPL